MKVALIGANGFIGTRLVEMFHLGGLHDVTAVVRRTSSLALPARFQIETRVADALSAESLATAISGCDAVVHAAIGDPAQIERMPAALAEAAAKAGVKRVIYLSSASVHGQQPDPGTDERSDLHTRHKLAYNNAKVRAEQSFFDAAREHRLDGYALRPGVVFGPRSRWIADLATELSENRAWLYSEGRGICNSIYVDNVVEAIRLSLENTGGAGQAYLIGDQETVTWADFYRSAASAVGVDWSRIHQLDKLPSFPRSWRDRTANAVAHPFVQRALPLVPNGVKVSAKAVLAAWTPVPRVNSWNLPEGPRPKITEEMALLQKCAWKFPHQVAARTLGYRPPVSFAEGMRRSFAWWRFASGSLAPAA